MYISAVVVVVFINMMMKSIAIIDFMMENVIPVLDECESMAIILDTKQDVKESFCYSS
jgi:hypothetical protein